MKGGPNENPNVMEFGYNALKIAVAGSSLVQDVRGNVRKRKNIQIDVNADVPMMKRQKKK